MPLILTKDIFEVVLSLVVRFDVAPFWPHLVLYNIIIPPYTFFLVLNDSEDALFQYTE